jgi:hypothetical protein
MATKLRSGYRPIEQAMRFVLWAEQLRTPPRVEDVMTRFEVCRATAYRLIGDYAEAKGLDRARKLTPEHAAAMQSGLQRYRARRRAEKAAQAQGGRHG